MAVAWRQNLHSVMRVASEALAAGRIIFSVEAWLNAEVFRRDLKKKEEDFA